MTEKEGAKESCGLGFRDFLRDCADGKLSGKTLTYDQWQRKIFRDSLSREYMEFSLNDLIQANGDCVRLFRGNFYDWMADVKGLTLTEDEAALRSDMLKQDDNPGNW